MPLQQFEHLLEIIEARSINRAALQLGLDQQRLRASVNSLERKLGFPLLQRSRTGVELTPEGSRILEDIRTLAAMQKRWNQLRRQREDTPTLVRLYATSGLINNLLNDVNAHLSEKTPRIVLELFLVRFDEIATLIINRKNLGLVGPLAPSEVADYAGKALAQGVLLQEVMHDDFQIIINRTHPLACRESLELGDLSQFIPAMYPREEINFYYRDIWNHFSRPFLHISKQESILHLVSRNPKIATIFPRSALSEPQRDLLKALPVRDCPMPGIICFFTPDTRKSPVESNIVRTISDAIYSNLHRI